MKKYMALLLCLALLTSVTACGNKPADNGDKPATTQATTTTTTVGESTTTTTTTTAGEDATTTTTTTAGDTTTGTNGGDTTAATVIPSTTTTVGTQAQEPVDPTTSTTTTTKKPTTTTSTTVVTKPTAAQPGVVLPAVGSDIDVVKKKNRIRVSAASAVSNADGTVAVSLTVKNYSSNWITEETDWVEYTCYDKDGKVVQAATKIAIGCIDTKKHPVKTFTFDVPASTAEVKLTNSKIVYWTEWS